MPSLLYFKMAALVAGRNCLRYSISFQITQTRTYCSAKPKRAPVRSTNKIYKHIRPNKTFDRRVYDCITQPLYVTEEIPMVERCGRNTREKVKVVNPYEEYLFKKCYDTVWNNSFMIVCQPLPMTSKKLRMRRLLLQKNGFNLYSFSNAFMRRALEGTKRENMIPWFVGNNVFVCSKENNLHQFLKLVQKMPELIPLGGLMEDRLLSRQDLEKINKLPNIETLRGELVSILSQASGRETHRLLGSHQQTLSTNLAQFVKQSQEDSSGPSKTDSEEKGE